MRTNGFVLLLALLSGFCTAQFREQGEWTPRPTYTGPKCNYPWDSMIRLPGPTLYTYMQCGPRDVYEQESCASGMEFDPFKMTCERPPPRPWKNKKTPNGFTNPQPPSDYDNRPYYPAVQKPRSTSVSRPSGVYPPTPRASESWVPNHQGYSEPVNHVPSPDYSDLAVPRPQTPVSFPDQRPSYPSSNDITQEEEWQPQPRQTFHETSNRLTSSTNYNNIENYANVHNINSNTNRYEPDENYDYLEQEYRPEVDYTPKQESYLEPPQPEPQPKPYFPPPQPPPPTHRPQPPQRPYVPQRPQPQPPTRKPLPPTRRPQPIAPRPVAKQTYNPDQYQSNRNSVNSRIANDNFKYQPDYSKAIASREYNLEPSSSDSYVLPPDPGSTYPIELFTICRAGSPCPHDPTRLQFCNYDGARFMQCTGGGWLMKNCPPGSRYRDGKCKDLTRFVLPPTKSVPAKSSRIPWNPNARPHQSRGGYQPQSNRNSMHASRNNNNYNNRNQGENFYSNSRRKLPWYMSRDP